VTLKEALALLDEFPAYYNPEEDRFAEMWDHQQNVKKLLEAGRVLALALKKQGRIKKARGA
jgi:hypothetical protein